MQAVIYNYQDSIIHPSYESVAIRIAYMLGFKINSAGTSYRLLDFDNFYVTDKTERQLALLQNAHRKNEDEKNLEQTTEAIALLKELKKKKHLNRDEVILKNSIERNALGNFKQLKAHMKANLMNTGLPQLAELVDRNEIKISVVDVVAHEGKAGSKAAAISDILQLKHKEAGEDSLFFLTPEFFHPDFTTILSGNSDSEKQEREGYLKSYFYFPNVNCLTNAELMTLRNEMMTISTPLRQKLEEWMKMVYQNADEEITEKFLSTEVKEYSKAIDRFLDKNELLNHISRVNNEAIKIAFYFGEFPAKNTLEFFRYVKAVPDDSWTILEQEMKAEAFAGKRLPVLAISMLEEPAKEKTGGQPEALVKPVKKYIPID
jgi:hypothetical protein